MRKTLFLSILCAALLFASCDEKDVAATADTVTETSSEPTYIKEGERITITSMQEWANFNYDGNFTDNCKSFLLMFIEGNSKFAEFETVKLGKWQMIRDEEVYGYSLAFNFTVTESKLETLPIGEYKTIVTDAVDCYMTFDSAAPTFLKNEVTVLSSASEAVCDWINATYSWSVPEYGKATDEMQLTALNYFIDRYGEDGKILDYKFKELLSDKLGVVVNEDLFGELYEVKDKQLYIKRDIHMGVTDFAVIGEEEKEGVTTVTVQFFADCNRFIKSDVVEYYIDKEERIIGCERIYFSDYEPYGVTNLFDEKS
ncbi:MAG: hypothetical protein IJ002_00725 [Clostridia bacterium]|nr:hypothetical protein [Clostridia bacterium]